MGANPDQTFALWTTRNMDSFGPGDAVLDPSVVCQVEIAGPALNLNKC